MPRRSLMIVAAVVCLVGAACSSDRTADESTAAPTTGQPSTTAADATTTPASTTDAIAVTQPEVTEPGTTAEVTEPAPAGAGTTAEQTTTSAAPTTTASAPATTIELYTSALYSDAANWICRPDTEDLCDADLDLTVVAPDGSITVDPFVAAADPPVDCLYLYPTTSEDKTLNSDLVPGSELLTTKIQAARFSAVCDVYAPVYRSVTLAALFGQVTGDRAQGFEIAYADVLDAWHQYLANDNHGRGVILIGHSQGSSLLARLLREEIDGDAAQRDLLVSAYIVGASVAVPLDADVGGDLQEIPLCRALDQTGCVVTYMSFRSTAPPPENSFFGRPRSGEGMAGCVNPAAPEGGAAVLESAYQSGAWALADQPLTPTTPFMDLPGMVTAECKFDNGFSYLELTVQGDPADPRADDIAGDLTPEWGMHLIDVQVATGSLLKMAAAQIEAYTRL